MVADKKLLATRDSCLLFSHNEAFGKWERSQLLLSLGLLDYRLDSGCRDNAKSPAESQRRPSAWPLLHAGDAPCRLDRSHGNQSTDRHQDPPQTEWCRFCSLLLLLLPLCATPTRARLEGEKWLFMCWQTKVRRPGRKQKDPVLHQLVIELFIEKR